ncbi:MAG: AEC family transporter [Alphaproteobacteria bacterium]|nr:AEC family transporter [Alphaproteobacteria bacterium]
MQGDLFAVIAPVLITAAIGYAWSKSGRAFDTEFITTIVLTIATPCLVFSSLTRLPVAVETMAQVAVAYLVVLVLLGVGGAVFLRLVGWPAHSYLPAIMFGNLGNMGIPLAMFAYGEAGLALAVAGFAIHSVGQFTVGVSVASGSMSVRQLSRTPVVYGVIAALPLVVFEVRPPLWISNAAQLLGSMVVPLMLLTLGVALARLKVQRLGRSVVIAFVRLGGGLAAGFAAASLLGLEGTARGVLIIQAAMPLAVFNYVFAQRYKREPEDVAAAIIISTIVSFSTLPFLLLLIR